MALGDDNDYDDDDDAESEVQRRGIHEAKVSGLIATALLTREGSGSSLG